MISNIYMMNRTNKRTSYTLSGEQGGFQANLEVTMYEGGQRIEASGTLNKEAASHYVRYSVMEDGRADISVSGPEESCAAAQDALTAIVNAERQATAGEE